MVAGSCSRPSRRCSVADKLADLRVRLDSIRQLRELVGAMRSLAAARLHQAEATLPAVRDYAGVTAAALGDALALLPAERESRTVVKARAVIAICAEHGFVGNFSRKVLASTAEPVSQALLVVGSNGIASAREHGLAVTWSHSMATQLGAIEATAHDVVEEVYRNVAAGSFDAADVVFTARTGLVRRALVPLDRTAVPRRARQWPVVTHLPTEHLVERIIEEYVLAEVVQALVESFASENAARLQTMQAARMHVDETLADLEVRERRARQEQITDELLELATGAAALSR
jgi:F-type H+-transporting ATPase subunit gamma